MKKLVEINTVCNGSTGRIMCDIAQMINEKTFESFCFYGRGESSDRVNSIKIEGKFTVLFHVLLARLGFNGHGSYFATKKMIRKIKKINPNIIHMHNIHGYYLNLKVLFRYLKDEYKGKIIWTLHDCWSFTGHCPHFVDVSCDRWQEKCYNCPQLSYYPKTLFDTTKKEYTLKKKLFTGLNNMTIVTPSMWLKELVSKSFLRDYKIMVINNGINTDIFKPTYSTLIYDKYNVPKNKKIILGVASVWTKRKGFDIFLELSKLISNDYAIVLIGLSKKQLKKLPQNIIGIVKTESQVDLASFYTNATVFVNPSIEETFSMVTAEALACKTPVIVCGRSAPKELVGKDDAIIFSNSAHDYYEKIMEMTSNIKKNRECKIFSNKDMAKEYIQIYQ